MHCRFENQSYVSHVNEQFLGLFGMLNHHEKLADLSSDLTTKEGTKGADLGL